jgi:citrate synthase
LGQNSQISCFFPVLFCIARTAGWLAHWKEQLEDKTPIFNPQQVYVGDEKRSFVPMHQREQGVAVGVPKVRSRKNLPQY